MSNARVMVLDLPKFYLLGAHNMIARKLIVITLYIHSKSLYNPVNEI